MASTEQRLSALERVVAEMKYGGGKEEAMKNWNAMELGETGELTETPAPPVQDPPPAEPEPAPEPEKKTLHARHGGRNRG